MLNTQASVLGMMELFLHNINNALNRYTATYSILELNVIIFYNHLF